MEGLYISEMFQPFIGSWQRMRRQKTLCANKVGSKKKHQVQQVSLNGTHFGGSNKQQMYGNFEELPYNSAFFGLVI